MSNSAAEGFVIDCPVCKRTVWRWAVCWHGKRPPALAPATAPAVEVPEVKTLGKWVPPKRRR